MTFKQKLDQVIEKNNSLLCIGLDPELEKIPDSLKKNNEPMFEFNKAVIDSTKDLVCAYKPNIAFYEAYGLEGLKQLKKTIAYLKNQYPQIPLILDAKRADIGNTAKMYAKAVFDYWQADAVTVYPFLGLDAVQPFLVYQDKLIILLIKTSNPDAGMFQDLKVGNEAFYLKLAKEISQWDYKNIGIFIGATYPDELKKVRTIFPEAVFLSAGLGSQGGEVEQAVKAGVDRHQKGIMFNASRSIIYASPNKDFAQAAREKAKELRDKINQYRND